MIRVSLLPLATLLVAAITVTGGTQVGSTPSLNIQLHTGQDGSISDVAYSPNGRLVLTASGTTGKATLWDERSGVPLRAVSCPTGGSTNLPLIAADDIAIVACPDKTIRQFDLASGREVSTTAPLRTATIDALSFGATRRRLIVLSASIFEVDLETGKVVRVLDSPVIPAGVLSRDGRCAVTWTDDGVKVVDLERWAYTSKITGVSSFNVGAIATGCREAVLSQNKDLFLVDLISGKTKARWRPHSNGSLTLAFGDHVILSGGVGDAFAKIWDAKTGRLLQSVRVSDDRDNPSVDVVALSQDQSNFAAVASFSEQAKVISVSDGHLDRVLAGQARADLHLAVDPLERFVVTNGRGVSVGNIHVWDLRSGDFKVVTTGSAFVSALAVSADGNTLATGDAGGTVRIWRTSDWTEVWSFKAATQRLTTLALASDAAFVVVGSADGSIRVWNIRTRKRDRELKASIRYDAPGPLKGDWWEAVTFVQLSGDDTHVFGGGWSSVVTMWDVKTGAVIRRFSHDDKAWEISDGSLSKNNALLATADNDGSVVIWNTATGELRHRFPATPRRRVDTVGFTPDGELLVSGRSDGTIGIVRVSDGSELGALDSVGGFVFGIAFLPKFGLAVTTSTAGRIDFLDLANRRVAATAISFESGAHAFLAPDGRFDTDALNGDLPVSWTLSNRPFTALRSDVFLRDYYEPRLLSRFAARDKLPALRSLAELNWVQPEVAIEKVEWLNAASGRAEVTVRVGRATETFQQDAETRTVSTQVYDVRVFRDGQLVGWAPRSSMNWQLERPAEGDVQADVMRWRELTRVELQADGQKHLTFPVQVPRRTDLKEVTFTAYAFNEDRVKSATATRTLMVSPTLQPRRGTAYVITVGVNTTDSSPAWDLKYAANDARVLEQAVSARFREGGQFADVVPIRLVSDRVVRNDEGPATKAALKVILDRLTGRPIDAAALAAIPGAARLRQAEPEDLVLIGVSSHGYTDSRGIFHFVLADIGSGHTSEVTAALEARTLSSDELSVWLRDMDAGEALLIVDACHSEATVNTDGFKPGPMGSRGLGQLAYDKGMRVLAASRAEEAAIERGGEVQQGLLTYALVREGLEQGRADFQPPDGAIGLAEWLAYAVEAVPRLFAEGDARGSVGIKGARDGQRDGFLGRLRTPPRYQQPVLFDFARARSTIALMKEQATPHHRRGDASGPASLGLRQ